MKSAPRGFIAFVFLSRLHDGPWLRFVLGSHKSGDGRISPLLQGRRPEPCLQGQGAGPAGRASLLRPSQQPLLPTPLSSVPAELR